MGYLEDRAAAGLPASPGVQPAVAGTVPTAVPAPAAPAVSGYMQDRSSAIQVQMNPYFADRIQGMQIGGDRTPARVGPNPLTAGNRYTNAGDMNATPRSSGVDDRVTDESWAEAIGNGLYSAGGSVIEGLGSSFASIPEALRHVYDSAILATTSNAEEQAYLQDIIQREKTLGMRSEIAATIKRNTRLNPEDVVPGFWTQDLPQSLGYMGGFLAGGAGGLAVKAPLWLTTAALGGTTGAAQFYEDALAHGATSEQAATAYGIGSVVGLSEAVPVFRVFDRLDKYSGGALGKALQGRVAKLLATSATGNAERSFTREAVKEGFKGAFEESLQETFQNGMQNWTASDLVGYDEHRTLGENLDKAAETGGAVGFMMSTLAASLGLKMRGTPLETEVEKRLREFQEGGELTVDNLKDILLARQLGVNIDQDLATIKLENETKFNALSPQLQQLHKDRMAQYAHAIWGSREAGKWAGGYPDEYADLPNEPLQAGGQSTTLKDFANSAEDVAVNLNRDPTLSTGEQSIKLNWGKDAETVVRAFRDAFASIEGDSGPHPKIVLSFKTFSTRPPYGQAGKILVDKTTGATRHETYTQPKTANEEVVYRVFVDPKRLENPNEARGPLSTLFHELGHILVNLRVVATADKALADLQAGLTNSPAIRAANVYQTMYEKFLLNLTDPNYKGIDFMRDAGDLSAYTHNIFTNPQGRAAPQLNDYMPDFGTKGHYWANPHEFFARVVGSYAGSPGKENIFNILGLDEKTFGPEFQGTIAELRKFYTTGAGVDTTKYPTFEAFMRGVVSEKKLENSFRNPVAIQFVQDVLKGTMTPEQAIASFKGWNTYLDRYGKIIRWGTTILQLSKLNQHIPQLQAYVQKVQEWDAFRKQNEARAVDLITKAKELGKERSNRIFRTALEETVSGKFFSDADLAMKLGDAESLQMYQRIRGHFGQLLNMMEQVVVEQTKEAFPDPLTQQRKLAEVKKAFADMRAKPYFPLMRFGKFAVEVREKGTGVLLEYHLFENEGEQQDALEELRSAYPNEAVSKRPVKDFELGAQGMPFAFTQALEAKFAKMGTPLTPEQQRTMKELSYDFLPAKSFLRKFKQRRKLGGYSEDGMRALAAYTQNAVGFISRAKFGEQLQEQVRQLETDANWVNQFAPDEVKDRSKRHEIAQHMGRHYKYIMEPAGEWAALRSMGFLYYMGYNVKSAVINLTQVPFVTYPYLAARYGDAKAVAALARANGLMVKYWKDPKSLTTEEFDLLEKGRQQGWIDESLASELAVAATDGVVDRLLPIDVRGRLRSRELRKLGKHSYYKVAHWGSIPFHVIEKLNRSVTALAAHELAMKGGKTHEEAIVAARDAVQQTQYEYSRWARPEMMRGKKGALFLFKSYLQGTLFFLVNDPGAWRYLTMLAVVGGLQGLPGADDLMDLIDGLGTPVREFLGFKDPKVDIRTELRKDAAEMLKDLDVNPDIFFRGISSQSFGLSMLGDALGIPIPNVDVSGSLSMGNIVPGTDILKKMYKTDSPQELAGQITEDVAGPLGSMAMGAMAPWVRDDPDSWRRWERALPLSVRNVSKALRISAAGGQETTAGGEVIANFDINDPRDVAELASQALGFTPTKVSKGWERYMAELEVTSYWLAKKSALMSKFNYANELKDREGRADALAALKEYNRIVPYPSMKISAEDVRRSADTYLLRRAKLSRGLALQTDFVKLRQEYAKAYGAIPEEGSQGTAGQAPVGLPPGNGG